VGGPNFVETMLRLGAERDAVSVVTDQTGCPTFTGHLAGALVALAETGPRGIVHVAGAGACTWNEFAVEIFRQAGVDCRVDPTTTADMARPAPRPAYSVLASERPGAPRLPDWRQGLRAYLAERAPAEASA
jgi:dTDP-4-dehydrorhamnose reductase